jgi:hypothetical protein
MKLKSNQLAHIDNNHYRLTVTQARQFCIDGKLPREGYAKRADNTKLASVTFGKIEHYPTSSDENNCRFREFENVIRDNSRCEVLRTPLSWFNGEPVESQWVWALHVFNPA